MPLRRTKRSNGLTRSRWKGGSHEQVENTHAKESRPDGIAFKANLQTEPLVTAPYLFHRSYEPEVSTRDCPAKTGADARIEEFAANGEECLALRPYGREKKTDIRDHARYVRLLPGGGRSPIRETEQEFPKVE